MILRVFDRPFRPCTARYIPKVAGMVISFAHAENSRVEEVDSRRFVQARAGTYIKVHDSVMAI